MAADLGQRGVVLLLGAEPTMLGLGSTTVPDPERTSRGTLGGGSKDSYSPIVVDPSDHTIIGPNISSGQIGGSFSAPSPKP